MNQSKGVKATKKLTSVDLLNGSIAGKLLLFAIPLFFGQLLQQLYNVVDAWVIGKYADDAAFAAVGSAGNIIFLIVGLFNGISIGGSVIISKYFGAGDKENLSKAIHTNFLFGIISSVFSTVIGLLLVPQILDWIGTPPNVLPESLTYFSIYFAGVSTIIMFNISMAIMRALGDSLLPLIFLIVSSLTNVALDFLFVAGLGKGVAGAAVATVISQGISVVLCFIRLFTMSEDTRIRLKKLRFHKNMMIEVLKQGLPTGIQNAVISIGNIVVQSNINSFGEFAMAGVAAYSKIEGFVFLPIMSMSMSLPTFISQNLGAEQYVRAKKGAVFGTVFGVITAELMGLSIYLAAPKLLSIFVDSPESLFYGTTHMHITSLFYFLLALSHCAAGVLRGCGKAFVPMAAMLAFWCGIRVLYVNTILDFVPKFQMISWAYPITWTLSSILLVTFLLCLDWKKALKK